MRGKTIANRHTARGCRSLAKSPVLQITGFFLFLPPDVCLFWLTAPFFVEWVTAPRLELSTDLIASERKAPPFSALQI
jgi:hypothetical protein